jgi:peptide/nickel transport system substrate-binding protein
LAARVKAGKLPPLAQRLPANPLVVQPAERIGVYGGEWHTCLLGPSDTVWLFKTIGYEHLVSWDPEFTEPVPNVAEAVETSNGGRTYTFTLRKGMRWSDGEPFTAADVVFAYNDVLAHPDIGALPDVLMAGGRPATVRMIGDLTVEFTFAEPYGLFLQQLASPSGSTLTSTPRHYLERFHPSYNPSAQEEAKREGYADWVERFDDKGGIGGMIGGRWKNPDIPTLGLWRITTPLGKGTRVVAERNPYYWKTDADGSQLPYIDRVIFDVVDTEEVILLKASNGEFDFHSRHITSLANKPVLARGRKEGGYRFVPMRPSGENDMIIALNLAHEDPALREVFNNKDFRIGLSHAIDREEIIAVAFQRQGRPWQVAPRPDSEFFDEEMATQYIEFDVAKANAYLDRAGYAARDDEGFRLRPDGRRLSFVIEIAHPAYITYWVDGMQLVVKYWRDVGLDVQLRSEDRALFYERKAANKHDATVFNGFTGMANAAMLDARWYFPHNAESNFAIPWATWFMSNGADGEKPPPAPLKQMRLYREMLRTPDIDEAKRIFAEILRIAKEEFYVIGTVMPTEAYGIAGNDFHNVPSMPVSWIYPDPGPARPEQFYLG